MIINHVNHAGSDGEFPPVTVLATFESAAELANMILAANFYDHDKTLQQLYAVAEKHQTDFIEFLIDRASAYADGMTAFGNDLRRIYAERERDLQP